PVADGWVLEHVTGLRDDVRGVDRMPDVPVRASRPDTTVRGDDSERAAKRDHREAREEHAGDLHAGVEQLEVPDRVIRRALCERAERPNRGRDPRERRTADRQRWPPKDEKGRDDQLE